MSIFPGAISSFLGFTSGHTLSADQHAAQHNSEQAEIVAAQTKIGTGSSTPTSGMLLRGNGAGTSAWAQVGLTTDVTGVLPIANGGTGAASASQALTNLGALTIQQIYPIGCIYTEITGVNPATTFGFGTWVAFGAGSVLAGFNSGDVNFGTVLQTGGALTHSHTSSITTNSQNTTTSAGASLNHTHAGVTTGAGTSAGVSQDHTHDYTHTHTTLAGGSASSLSPYVTVYFWRRTA